MQREISATLGKRKVVLRETGRAVSPYGALCVVVEYLNGVKYAGQVRRAMPFQFRSPNAIDPVETFSANRR